MTLLSTASKCTATTKAGTRCRAPAMNGAALCYHHATDPATIESRAAARSKGGRARHGRKLDAAGDADLSARLCLQQAQNTAMALEPSVASARALAYVASVILAQFDAEERLARIVALEALQGGKP